MSQSNRHIDEMAYKLDDLDLELLGEKNSQKRSQTATGPSQNRAHGNRSGNNGVGDQVNIHPREDARGHGVSQHAGKATSYGFSNTYITTSPTALAPITGYRIVKKEKKATQSENTIKNECSPEKEGFRADSAQRGAPSFGSFTVRGGFGVDSAQRVAPSYGSFDVKEPIGAGLAQQSATSSESVADDQDSGADFDVERGAANLLALCMKTPKKSAAKIVVTETSNSSNDVEMSGSPILKRKSQSEIHLPPAMSTRKRKMMNKDSQQDAQPKISSQKDAGVVSVAGKDNDILDKSGRNKHSSPNRPNRPVTQHSPTKGSDGDKAGMAPPAKPVTPKKFSKTTGKVFSTDTTVRNTPRKRAPAKDFEYIEGRPIPTSIEDSTQADQRLWKMKQDGADWPAIRQMWLEETGIEVALSTLPNRYNRLKTAFGNIPLQPGDDKLLIEAKREVDEEFEDEKWGRIALRVQEKGGFRYLKESLKGYWSNLESGDGTDEE